MKLNNIFSLIAILSLVLCPRLLFCQPELVNALNTQLIPIKSTEVNGDLSDLSRLKIILGDKKVVALGEATHGTHEFFTMKRRMVEFLVEEMGFKTFVIEADFTGAQAMNNYVLNVTGDPVDALQKMGIGVWFTKEFIEMIEWMKAYNLTKSPADKISFFGCDMQWAINSAPLLINGTIKFKTLLSADAVSGITAIRKYTYGQIDKSQIPLLNAAVSELKAATILEDDSAKLAIDKRYVANVLQTITYAEAKYLYDRDVIRDKQMADNCNWIYQYAHKNKMIIWAHNLHIAKEATKENNLPMGFYLSQNFSGDYYAVGFSFNQGDFRAYNTDTKQYGVCSVPDITSKKATELVFKQCSVPNFFLDFNSSSQIGIISTFLNQKLNARAIGGEYNPQKQANGEGGTTRELVKMYDGVIFINKTTAATGL